MVVDVMSDVGEWMGVVCGLVVVVILISGRLGCEEVVDDC